MTIQWAVAVGDGAGGGGDGGRWGEMGGDGGRWGETGGGGRRRDRGDAETGETGEGEGGGGLGASMRLYIHKRMSASSYMRDNESN